MAKDKLTDYDSTAANNLDVGGISVAEGMLPSGVNNAIRELMSHQADAFGAGTPLYVDQTNNRVGVGTASPSASLDVDGTIKLDGNYPTGTNNVALGDTALDSGSLSGNGNTAVGSGAMTVNTSGTLNSAFGYAAMFDNTTGQYNTASGFAALENNTTGGYNTAFGASALNSNTTASNNTAVGYQAAYSNTTGSPITAIGRKSLYSNTTGIDNTALGRNALFYNTTGSSNTALGHQALDANTTASYNTAVGYQAGYNTTTAQTVTYIGYQAGYNGTGANNTFVGTQAGYAVTTGAKNTILGRYDGNQGGLDIRTSSNYIVLSDGDGNPRIWADDVGRLFAPASYTYTTASAANLSIASTGLVERSTSSARYKNTINDATHGLTELLTLRPVTYKGNNDGDTIFGGLIAEEVHDAGLTEFVQYNDDGEPDALAYGNMVSLCIKAIQEQQETITALEARIAALESN